MSGEVPANDGELFERARRMTRSPLLYVGALTVAFAHEITAWLVASGATSETWAVAALVPVTLVLLYAQLLALAYYLGDGDAAGR